MIRIHESLESLECFDPVQTIMARFESKAENEREP